MSKIVNLPQLYTVKYQNKNIKQSPALSASKSALTELRIEQLTTTGATYYVNDQKQPGLSVRVSAGGVKAYVFTKHKDGRFTRITLGRAGAMRLDAARRAAQALHGELALGIDVGAARRAAKREAKSETMQEAFDRFLGLKARRPSTMTDYQYLWRLVIPAGLKRKPVKDVTAGDIEALKRALGSKHRTANKAITLISAIMAKSGRWADNPARGITKHQERVRTRRLSAEELSRVWTALAGEDGWGDFFRLLILTGARRTPFCAMRWRDLDLDAGVWTVPVEWAKSKREMAVPLSSEAVRILRLRRQHISRGHCQHSEAITTVVTDGEPLAARNVAGAEGWVWPSTDSETGHVVNPEKPWRRILKAAGVEVHTTLHDIRRTLGVTFSHGWRCRGDYF
jgi:integrase